MNETAIIEIKKSGRKFVAIRNGVTKAGRFDSVADARACERRSDRYATHIYPVQGGICTEYGING
jgi:hypothetical protein|tara:strand:+ start:231 stop:425 length:195 start_codon:yes stop_codon:yes gene_type:complete